MKAPWEIKVRRDPTRYIEAINQSATLAEASQRLRVTESELLYILYWLRRLGIMRDCRIK